MTKKRKIEILELLRQGLINRDGDGLCVVADFLDNHKKINKEEYKWLVELIKNNKPRKLYRNDGIITYYWMWGEQKPRMRWINKRIKEIEKLRRKAIESNTPIFTATQNNK